MKALVYYGPNDLRYTDAADPAPASREVLIRVRVVGICGSDVHGYQGKTGRRNPPMIMGHEIAGDVVATGDAVTKVTVGDRVAVDPVIYCNQCAYCAAGQTNICKNRRVVGVSIQNETINGAMAELIAVPEHVVNRLPDDLTYEQGALIDPLAVAVHGVKMAGNLENKRVAIIGAGQIGLFALQSCIAFGAESTTVIDISDSRLSVAKDLGADAVLNAASFTAGKRDFKEACQAAGGFDVVIEAVGAEQTIQQSLYLVKSGGIVVLMGLGQKEAAIDAHHLVENEITLKGTYIFVEKDLPDAIRLFQAGAVNIAKMISRVEPLEKGPEMFAALATENSKIFKVLLVP